MNKPLCSRYKRPAAHLQRFKTQRSHKAARLYHETKQTADTGYRSPDTGHRIFGSPSAHTISASYCEAKCLAAFVMTSSKSIPRSSSLLREVTPLPWMPQGNDRVEVRQLCVHVESEAVHRNPAADSNTDCTDFVVANPRAIEALHTVCREVVVCANPDHRFFEGGHVFSNVGVRSGLRSMMG